MIAATPRQIRTAIYVPDSDSDFDQCMSAWLEEGPGILACWSAWSLVELQSCATYSLSMARYERCPLLRAFARALAAEIDVAVFS